GTPLSAAAPSTIDAAQIIASVREVAYEWQIASDVLIWGGNVADVLPRPDPASETRLGVEDNGRWFAGADGRPARAHGLVRVINERYEHVRRLTYLARCDDLTGELN